MAGDSVLEELIERANSTSVSFRKRRSNVRNLFNYLSREIPDYLGLKRQPLKLKIGRYYGFKKPFGWKNIAATAYYDPYSKTVALNERALKPPYSGVTLSDALSLDSCTAIAIVLSHEIGHTVDNYYNAYNPSDSTVNKRKLDPIQYRILQETLAEVIAASFLSSRVSDFDYHRFLKRTPNDIRQRRIYTDAVKTAYTMTSMGEEDRIKTIRKLIAYRDPVKKIANLQQ